MIDFTPRIAAAQQEQRTIEQQQSEYQQALAQLEQRRLLCIGRLQALIELDSEQRAERERVAADEIEKQRIIAEQRILHAQQETQSAESEQETNDSHFTSGSPIARENDYLDRVLAGGDLTRSELERNGAS